MITEQEAKALIEAWLRTYSTFEADSICVTSAANGTWVAQVACGVVAWNQVISPEGVVGAPVWIE